MKTEYKIVSSSVAQDLERMVNEQLKLGWEPVGGLCIGGVVMPLLHQAMILQPSIRVEMTHG